jgi:hypothetical protein
MICPKCGRPVEEAAVICPGCDFILDTRFLGGDILDEEHQLRPGQGGVDPAVFNLADAVILGNIGDDTSSFETSDSGFHIKRDMQAARLYVSGRSQAVMSPDAVIAKIGTATNVRLTPFEKHVLRFIDGKRPVESIRRQAGLDEAEVKTALANLADKGVVKVVGRALADAGEFDAETAPGIAPKSKPRRMRGTLVGAVVVVGDAADQAIDDAFRTQVRVAPRIDVEPSLSRDNDDDVFSSADSREGAEDPAGFDDDDALFEAGTSEVPMRRQQTSSTNTVRPASVREAVNAGRGTGRVANVVDASDGFDEFGDAAELATAMVQQPSLSSSGDSSLPGVAPPPRTGVFADPGPGLSDLDDFDAPGVDDLADSRVEPRPILPPLPPAPIAPVAPVAAPRIAPPAVPSLSSGALASSEPSMNDDERAAFSGGVWEDGSEPTNIREPQQRPPTSERSTSLSALLDSDESEENDNSDASLPAPTAPTKPVAARPANRPPQLVFDSAEENTAFRPPPQPMAAPMGPFPNPAKSPSTPFDPSSVSSWSGHAIAPPPPAPKAAPPPRIAESRGAADDLFPDDDESEEAAIADESDLEGPTAAVALTPLPPPPPPRAPPPPPPPPAPRAPPAPMPTPPAPPPVDDDPNKTGWYEPGQSALSDLAGGFGDDGTDQHALMSAPAFAPVRRPMNDETMPPSEMPVDDESSAWSNSVPRRPQPPPPEPSRFESRAQDSMSRGPVMAPAARPTSVNALDSSSVEALDSAMVIRPAIKATPLVLAAKKPARPPAGAPPVEDDDDLMVDPDATMNLPPMPRSREGEARRQRGQNSEPSGAVAVAEPSVRANANRRPPTEDMRRKARNLMEQAQNDHAIGRIGAARMNAKLATIYDPENETYRRILAAWEDRPKAGSGDSSAMTARPEYVQLYEAAQDLEDDDDIDGALAMLERGLRIAPNAAAFHNRIGVILAMRKREYARAADEIEKAISLEPDNPHYRNNLGKVMAKANKRQALSG